MKKEGLFRNLIRGAACSLQTEQFCRVDKFSISELSVGGLKMPKESKKIQRRITFFTGVAH